ncbi:MAG: U32 family peptidase [Actinobacteria bacterium]|nr:U32 family peptidase [Actinomycetota bacterium]
MQKIELVSPAGGWDHLKAAINGGADAVYLGYKKFGARAYAENFDFNNLKKAVSFAHRNSVKVYLTLNTLLKDSEFEELAIFLNEYSMICRDGIIIQDFGLYKVLRDLYPFQRIHASTQLNIHNLYSVELLKKLDFSRVVLAREMTLDEIGDISDKKIMEIEVFAHGSQCYSYSGSCYFSSFTGERSGNRGRCTQPCRMKYKLISINKNEHRLCGEGYLLSKSDLCTLELIPELVKTGINAVKLEGRMKSPDYVGIITRIYRKYIDLFYEDPGNYSVSEEDMYKITQIFSRDLGTGYFRAKYPKDIISLKKAGSIGNFLGRIFDIDFEKKSGKPEKTGKTGGKGKTVKVVSKVSAIYLKSKWKINSGDIIEIWTNRGNERIVIKNFIYQGNENSKNIYKIPVNKIINVSIGDRVFKFFDKELELEAKQLYEDENKNHSFKKNIRGWSSSVSTGLNLYADIEKLGKNIIGDYLGKFFLPLSRPGKPDISNIKEKKYLSLAATVYDKMPAFIAADAGADKIIYDGFNEGYGNDDDHGRSKIKDIVGIEKYCENKNIDFIIKTPQILYDADFMELKKNIIDSKGPAIKNFLVSNLGMLGFLTGEFNSNSIHIFLGSPLNIFNALSVNCFKNLYPNFIKGVSLSPELSAEEISNVTANSENFLEENFNFSVYGYGYYPIINSRYKLSFLDEKYDSKKEYYVQDLKGYKFRIYPGYNENIILFNSRKICLIFDLYKLIKSGINMLEIDTRFLTDEECSKVIKIFKNAAGFLRESNEENYKKFTEHISEEALFKNYTKGHLLRAVL